MYPDHFLDVNILIGSRFTLDTQHLKTAEYMLRPNIRRCTSFGGFNTAKSHFDFIRYEGRPFLKELSTKHFSNDDYVDIAQRVFNSLDDFKKTRRLSPNAYKRLYSFLKGVMRYLVRDIQKDKLNGVKDFCSDLLLEIERVNRLLVQDCNYSVQARIRLYDRKGENGETLTYSSKFKELYDIIQDKEDVEIFLDCCHIQRHIVKSNMCFVTTDKAHFSGEETKKRIEAVAPSINIQPPNYRS